ncbi:MAG: gamma carbonic anhydrase family protein, partial [Chloroflexi bacterium]|nr:gamma carbonic anhydrase family protein [Chloroflexota bacterium]
KLGLANGMGKGGRMIRGLGGKSPKIAASAFVSEAAYVVGDVVVGENSSVWHGAVVRGDLGEGRIGAGMKIGHDTHIEDNAVVHAATEIGSNVVIGHGAVVEAFRVGDNVLIGNNATVMASAEIGSFCIVAAGAVVLPWTKIPDRSFVVGTPAEVKGQISAKQIAHMEETLALTAAMVKEYKKDQQSSGP